MTGYPAPDRTALLRRGAAVAAVLLLLYAGGAVTRARHAATFDLYPPIHPAAVGPVRVRDNRFLDYRTWSYQAAAVADEVREFYAAALRADGWQPSGTGYQRGELRLAVGIVPSDTGVRVSLLVNEGRHTR